MRAQRRANAHAKARDRIGRVVMVGQGSKTMTLEDTRKERTRWNETERPNLSHLNIS